MFRLVLASGLVAVLFGCSALHWGGDVSGRRPGVCYEQGSLFWYSRFEVSSDCNARVGEMTLDMTTPGEETTGPGTSRKLVIRDAEFGQSASAVVKEEPAKIDAIGRLQMTQVEYARVTWNGVTGLAKAITPIVGMLSGVFNAMTDTSFNAMFPGGFSVGSTKVTKPNEATAVLAEMMRALNQVENSAPPPATQPSN